MCEVGPFFSRGGGYRPMLHVHCVGSDKVWNENKLITYREGIAGNFVKDKLGPRYEQLAAFFTVYNNLVEYPYRS